MPKILFVKDDEPCRDFLSRRLKRKGFEIVIARNGNEGIEIAQNDLPDLILVDMTYLTPQEGDFVINTLRTISITQEIPIISIVNPETPLEKQNMMGVDDYEVKPIELPRLLEKINRLLSSSDSKEE